MDFHDGSAEKQIFSQTIRALQNPLKYSGFGKIRNAAESLSNSQILPDKLSTNLSAYVEG